MNVFRVFIKAAVFGVVFLLVPLFVNAAPVKNTLEVSGWVPYWRTATGTADTIPNLQYLTAVHPFGYTVADDGTVYDTAMLSEEPWKSFITLAKIKKVRVIPTVMWGDGEAMHRILSDTDARIKLEDEI